MAFEVEYFTLDSTASANKYVELSGTPAVSDNVAMDLIGGSAQALNGDFGVDTSSIPTRVVWNDASYALYSLLAADDKIRIIYDRS